MQVNLLSSAWPALHYAADARVLSAVCRHYHAERFFLRLCQYLLFKCFNYFVPDGRWSYLGHLFREICELRLEICRLGNWHSYTWGKEILAGRNSVAPGTSTFMKEWNENGHRNRKSKIERRLIGSEISNVGKVLHVFRNPRKRHLIYKPKTQDGFYRKCGVKSRFGSSWSGYLVQGMPCLSSCKVAHI